MKKTNTVVAKLFLLLILSLMTTACLSSFKPQLGMTEKHWLRTTFIADIAYMKDNITAYRSGGAYYYFKDGLLVKIDEGMLPPQQINMDIKTTSTSEKKADIYDELKS